MSITSTMYTACSGLDSFTKAISVVSDNVANVASLGFKANEVLFADMVGASYSTLSGSSNRAGTGTTLLTMRTDVSQGPVTATSNWSDLAINGDGYFVLVSPKADDTSGTKYYTRDGSFHMDKDGYLVNAQGYRVVGADNAPIQLDPDTYAEFYVEADGSIYGVKPDGTVSDDPVDTVEMAVFDDQEGLVRQGGNLFTPGPYSGDARLYSAATDDQKERYGKIMSRSLETSNVDMTKELVNMVIYQADFNANSKCITVGKQLFDTVNNLIR